MEVLRVDSAYVYGLRASAEYLEKHLVKTELKRIANTEISTPNAVVEDEVKEIGKELLWYIIVPIIVVLITAAL